LFITANQNDELIDSCDSESHETLEYVPNRTENISSIMKDTIFPMWMLSFVSPKLSEIIRYEEFTGRFSGPSDQGQTLSIVYCIELR
jgi:hypothetical protein